MLPYKWLVVVNGVTLNLSCKVSSSNLKSISPAVHMIGQDFTSCRHFYWFSVNWVKGATSLGQSLDWVFFLSHSLLTLSKSQVFPSHFYLMDKGLMWIQVSIGHSHSLPHFISWFKDSASECGNNPSVNVQRNIIHIFIAISSKWLNQTYQCLISKWPSSHEDCVLDHHGLLNTCCKDLFTKNQIASKRQCLGNVTGLRLGRSLGLG